MLLIITNRNDLACDYLILRLKERSIRFTRFNTDEYPDSISIDINVSCGSIDYSIHFNEYAKQKLEELSAVYFRQPIPPIHKTAINEMERSFGDNELCETLRSLWRVIPEHLWLNHPKKLWIASNKLEQLLAATNVGFDIPDTLISSSYNKIYHFYEQHNMNIIVKAVRNGFIQTNDKMLLAGSQELPTNFFEDFFEFAQIPMTYQEKIDEKLDIRVVIVGKELFATEIHMEQDTLDWRIADIAGEHLQYVPIRLPLSIEKKCHDIVSYFGLKYSSMDIALDKNGRYVFLDLNPNGQWGWIEQTVDYPIRDAIIKTLGIENNDRI